MTSKGLQLLAYGRVSDVKGRSGETFISPEDQMAKCRAYAETYEHTILEEGLDLDVSGGVMDRPVLNRFVAKIKAGKAQGLIVAKLDRFSRSSKGALNALEEIEAAGGVLISAQEQIDSTTAAGRFVRAIFLATAEWERERIGESWNSAQTRAVERGVHISRHVPPGYVRGGGGKLEPHPKHGKAISRAYDMAAKGISSADIARFLTEQGVTSGDNEKTIWQGTRVSRLLKNRVYLGQARYGEIVNDNAHEPLTTLETWHLAQRPKRGAAVSSDSSYLLSGIVRCASCRYAMRPQKGSGKGKRKVGSYRCQCDSANGRCEHPSVIVMSRLDEYVLEAFFDRVILGRENEPVEQDNSYAVAALEEAREALVEIERLHRDGELGAVAYGKALEAALVEVASAERELAARQTIDIGAAAVDLRPQLEETQGRLEAGESVVDLMRENGGLELARRSLASEIEAVFVRPAASRSKTLPISDRVKIVWAGEEELELPKRGHAAFAPTPYTW